MKLLCDFIPIPERVKQGDLPGFSGTRHHTDGRRLRRASIDLSRYLLLLMKLARLTRFERATPAFGGQYSIP